MAEMKRQTCEWQKWLIFFVKMLLSRVRIKQEDMIDLDKSKRDTFL